MRIQLRTLPSVISVLYAAGLSIGLWANVPRAGAAANADESSSATGWHIGMEVELSGETGIRNVMPFFDVDVPREVLSRTLTPRQVADYLTPETFVRLPKSIQEKLTGGQGLEVKFEGVEKEIQKGPASPSSAARMPPTTPSGIVLPRGYNASEGRREILLQTAKAPGLPSAKPEPEKVFVPEHVKSETRWRAIADAWAKMPIADRVALIEPGRLAPQLQAQLVLDGKAKLTPKSSLAPNVKDLLQRLEWDLQGNLLEFRHKVPVQTKDEYLKDLRLFGDMAGITRYIEDPNTKFPPEGLRFTHHVHVSYYKADGSLRPIAQQLNRLRLLEMTAEGRGAGALKSGFGFLTVDEKGLIRQLSDTRIESRSHADSPAVEIQKLMDSMSLPRAEASAKLKQAIAVKVNQLSGEIVDAARLGLSETDPRRRTALAQTVANNLAAIASGSPQTKFQDVLDARATPQLRSELTRSILDLNISREAFQLILPQLGRAEVETLLPRLFQTFVRDERGETLLAELYRIGFTKDQVEAQIMREPVALFRPANSDDVAKVSKFLFNFSAKTQVATFERILGSTDQLEVVTAASGRISNLMSRDAVSASGLAELATRTESRIFELAPRTAEGYAAYQGSFDKLLLGPVGVFRRTLGRASMTRISTDPGFPLETLRAPQLEFIDRDQIALLRTRFLNADAEATAIFKLDSFGQPVDVARMNAIFAMPDSPVSYRAENALLSFVEGVMETRREPARAALIEAATNSRLNALFDTVSAAKYKIATAISKELIKELPSPERVAFVEQTLKLEARAYNYRWISKFVEQASTNNLDPNWNSVLISQIAKIDFSLMRVSGQELPDLVPPSLVTFLRQNLERGGVEGELAAKAFDSILANAAVSRIFAGRAETALRPLYELRRRYLSARFTPLQLGEIAVLGPVGADIVLDEIERGRLDVIDELVEVQIAAKEVRTRLLVRTPVAQKRAAVNSMLYQALKRGPDGLDLLKDPGFAADVRATTQRLRPPPELRVASPIGPGIPCAVSFKGLAR